MKFFVCPNQRTLSQIETAKKCIDLLEKKLKVQCSVSRETDLALYGCVSHSTFDVKEADIVVAVGGDGAVLRASYCAYSNNKPLLGINGGRLGFLCALKVSDLNDIGIEYINNLVRSPRSLIGFTLDNVAHAALNDVVVTKSNFGETVELSLWYNGLEVTHWRGDGVIISTPTGSTSYNLSAGGPVLYTGVEGLVVTPICPHATEVKSIVFSDKSEITVKVVRSPNDHVLVYADGAESGSIAEEIRFSRAKRDLILLTQPDPLAVLKNK